VPQVKYHQPETAISGPSCGHRVLVTRVALCHDGAMDAPPAPAHDLPRAPDPAALREAALAHLARFGTTEHGLRQVLTRRIRRWAQRAAAAGLDEHEAARTIAALMPAIADIVADMARLGAVNDAAFAQSRTRTLTRSGRSGRAIGAHLAARGVSESLRAEALDARAEGFGGDADLMAALVLARKRRIGPFARPGTAPRDAAQDRTRAFGAMARAGFSHDIASRALGMDPDEAEARVIALKSA